MNPEEPGLRIVTDGIVRIVGAFIVNGVGGEMCQVCPAFFRECVHLRDRGIAQVNPEPGGDGIIAPRPHAQIQQQTMRFFGGGFDPGILHQPAGRVDLLRHQRDLIQVRQILVQDRPGTDAFHARVIFCFRLFLLPDRGKFLFDFSRIFERDAFRDRSLKIDIGSKEQISGVCSVRRGLSVQQVHKIGKGEFFALHQGSHIRQIRFGQFLRGETVHGSGMEKDQILLPDIPGAAALNGDLQLVAIDVPDVCGAAVIKRQRACAVDRHALPCSVLSCCNAS